MIILNMFDFDMSDLDKSREQGSWVETSSGK